MARSHLARATIAVAVLATVCSSAAPAGAAEGDRPQTIVTFAFDDALPDQLQVAPWLEAQGMRGTFYVNTGKVGHGIQHMSWAQVGELAAEGHEIGGHTIDHLALDASVPEAERRRQVCDDRQELIARGFAAPASFAYPAGRWDAAARDIVRDCGYTNARTTTTWDADEAGESLPPRDDYALRGETVLQSSSFDFLREITQRAERSTGGWLVLVIHDVCKRPCASPELEEWSADPDALRQYIDWLADREQYGTSVQTVGEVMEALMPPPPPPLCANGTDDDNDGKVDFPDDPGCMSGDDDDETDPTPSPPPPARDCANGLDDDDDGKVDFPGDPGCSSHEDDDETDPRTPPLTPVAPAPAPVALAPTPASAPSAPPAAAAVGLPVPPPATPLVDRKRPRVTLRGVPASRSVRRRAHRTLHLRVVAQDAGGVAGVAFLVEGKLLRRDLKAPFTAGWRTWRARRGLHTISVVAVDHSGNATRVTRRVRVR